MQGKRDMAEWHEYPGPTSFRTSGEVVAIEVPDHWVAGFDSATGQHWVGDPKGHPTLYLQQEAFPAEAPDRAGLLYVRRFMEIVESIDDMPGRQHLAYVMHKEDDEDESDDAEAPDRIQDSLAIIHAIIDFEEDGRELSSLRWYCVLFRDPVTVLLQRFTLVVPRAEARTPEVEALYRMLMLAAMRITVTLGLD